MTTTENTLSKPKVSTPKVFNKPTGIFVITYTAVALLGTAGWLWSGSFNWYTLLLAFVLRTLAGMSITGGYHRLFSHRSYDAPAPVRLYFALLGAAAFEGSIIDWSLDHRTHHRHIDTDKDPYNINDGFWWAHIGWMFWRRDRDYSPTHNADLWNDPIVAWQHKHYILIASLMTFVLPMLIAALWGDLFGGLLVAGGFRLIVNHHETWAINSVCHYFGVQTYSDKHTARDNWFTALFTYGEGYHNYHHEFASDYRNGIRWYDFDPTKWMIFGLSQVGLASELRRIRPEEIMRRKVQLAEKRLTEKLRHQPAALSTASQMIAAANEQLTRASERLTELRHQYQAAKKERSTHASAKRTMRASAERILHHQAENLHHQAENLHHQAEELRANFRAAQKDFRRSVALWYATRRGLMKLVS